MIWLIGGTSESVAIATLLSQHNLQYIITVTTSSALQLYQTIDKQRILVDKLSNKKITQLLQDYGITMIIDASHPFAINISEKVINICQKLPIKYIRYERPSLFSPPHQLFTYISSVNYLVEENSPLKNKRVLLTIGAKFLPLFTNYHHNATLYTRILPYPESISKAYESGFTCHRIIALRPPIDYTLEKALWQQWNIEIVITKAGGKAGGEDIKYKVAQELNIPLVIIKRPTLPYPLIINTLEELSPLILMVSKNKKVEKD